MCDLRSIKKFIGRKARKYLNYHKKFNKYMADFKQAQVDLLARKENIRQQLQDKHPFGKEQEAENWLETVEEMTNRAQGVEDKVNKWKYLFRPCLGKVVDETTQEIKKVCAKCQFSKGLEVNDPSTTKVKLPTEELAGNAADKVEEIYKYLMGDYVRKIRVLGMRGIGKTTVMKHVYNKLLEETKFTKVIWTAVTKDLDIPRLRKEIALQLKKELSEAELATIDAATLSEMLATQGSYVLILDDVWSNFSTEEVGILEPTENNGCKLVLITHLEKVVGLMGYKEVQLDCLSENEAKQLFLSKVRSQDPSTGQDMSPDPALESTMEDIVNECHGVPLAIVTVASCMRGISDPLVWQNSLTRLKQYFKDLSHLEEPFKFCYDCLEQKDLDCLLSCALYPENHVIQMEEISEYWIDEGLVDRRGNRKTVQNKGFHILNKFEDNHLLERVGEGTYIKMHDVARKMALDLTSKRFLVKAGMQLKELPNGEVWTEDLEKISLMHNSISKIPPDVKLPKFQKLTTLLLSHNSLEEIPEYFFQHIPKLKILDLSGNPIEKLPDSLSNLKNLTALLLRYCNLLSNLPSLQDLQHLRKLDLKGTKINKIPLGLEMLADLRYLNLGFTKHLKSMPDGFLSKLRLLQFLAIHPAPTRGKEISQLNKLEFFEGCFCKDVAELKDIGSQINRLHKYWIWVGDDLKDHVAFNPSMYNNKVLLVGFAINYGDEIILPYDIQQLQVVQCKGMRSLNDISGLKAATGLKECIIQGCHDLETLFSSECLQKIESLKLEYLYNLKGIFGETSVGTFSSLKEICVWGCGKLHNLFSAKWDLPNLEEITVGDCYGMEEIIETDEERSATGKNTLPKLRTIQLRGLPKLKSICCKNGRRVCDSLRHIYIKDCPKLKRLPLLGIDSTGRPSPPPSLKEIFVDPKEWWESVDWDHADAMNLLIPMLKFWDKDSGQWKQAV